MNDIFLTSSSPVVQESQFSCVRPRCYLDVCQTANPSLAFGIYPWKVGTLLPRLMAGVDTPEGKFHIGQIPSHELQK